MAQRRGSPILEILVLFLAVYLLQLVSHLADLMTTFFVLSQPVAEHPWTVVTSIYAHSSLQHLISNAVALVLFGFPVAAATSRIRFHLFFITTGAVAGVTQILLYGSGVLGASGAVFALLGYLLVSNRLTTVLGRWIGAPTWLTYGLYIALAAIVTLATAEPGVALVAHFTGFVLGLVAGRYNLLRTR